MPGNNNNVNAEDNSFLPNDFCTAATRKVSDPEFQKQHKKTKAPTATVAAAKVVVEETTNKNKFDEFFDGLTMTIPPSKKMHSSPSYHSICGVKLLLVDWKKSFGIDVCCPNCNNALKQDRANFLKNKTLFPVFHITGPPSWCMVMSMQCTPCCVRCDANDGITLNSLPACVAAAHTQETKHALNNRNLHLSKSATEVFDLLMTTHGNGEICSRLLCNTINREHLN